MQGSCQCLESTAGHNPNDNNQPHLTSAKLEPVGTVKAPKLGRNEPLNFDRTGKNIPQALKAHIFQPGQSCLNCANMIQVLREYLWAYGRTTRYGFTGSFVQAPNSFCRFRCSGAGAENIQYSAFAQPERESDRSSPHRSKTEGFWKWFGNDPLCPIWHVPCSLVEQSERDEPMA